jgi:hypothetical protein
MQNLFINIKNEQTYDIVGFARRKAPGGDWKTEIAYSPDGSPQIYVRTVEDFFRNFIPHNCWSTATDEQKAKMKEVLVNSKGVGESKPLASLPQDYRPIPRNPG